MKWLVFALVAIFCSLTNTSSIASVVKELSTSESKAENQFPVAISVHKMEASGMVRSEPPLMSPSDEDSPSSSPSSQPWQPTSSPSFSISTAEPSPSPSNIEQTASPYSTTTQSPSMGPVDDSPSSSPSDSPSSKPSYSPESSPTYRPNSDPSCTPSSSPSSLPSSRPSVSPSYPISSSPSTIPSSVPSSVSSTVPSTVPSCVPSTMPSLEPSSKPSSTPSSVPSISPDSMPTSLPSSFPTISPSADPSASPTVSPSSPPTSMPTPKSADLGLTWWYLLTARIELVCDPEQLYNHHVSHEQMRAAVQTSFVFIVSDKLDETDRLHNVVVSTQPAEPPSPGDSTNNHSGDDYFVEPVAIDVGVGKHPVVTSTMQRVLAMRDLRRNDHVIVNDISSSNVTLHFQISVWCSTWTAAQGVYASLDHLHAHPLAAVEPLHEQGMRSVDDVLIDGPRRQVTFDAPPISPADLSPARIVYIILGVICFVGTAYFLIKLTCCNSKCKPGRCGCDGCSSWRWWLAYLQSVQASCERCCRNGIYALGFGSSSSSSLSGRVNANDAQWGSFSLLHEGDINSSSHSSSTHSASGGGGGSRFPPLHVAPGGDLDQFSVHYSGAEDDDLHQNNYLHDDSDEHRNQVYNHRYHNPIHGAGSRNGAYDPAPSTSHQFHPHSFSNDRSSSETGIHMVRMGRASTLTGASNSPATVPSPHPQATPQQQQMQRRTSFGGVSLVLSPSNSSNFHNNIVHNNIYTTNHYNVHNNIHSNGANHDFHNYSTVGAGVEDIPIGYPIQHIQRSSVSPPPSQSPETTSSSSSLSSSAAISTLHQPAEMVVNNLHYPSSHPTASHSHQRTGSPAAADVTTQLHLSPTHLPHHLHHPTYQPHQHPQHHPLQSQRSLPEQSPGQLPYPAGSISSAAYL